MPDESARGRRIDPYDIRLARWCAIQFTDELWLRNTLVTTYKSPCAPVQMEVGFDDRPKAGYAAYRILERIGVPLLRRFLMATLTHVGGFEPTVVQSALTDLRTYTGGAVMQRVFSVEAESNSHLYMLRKPQPQELEALRRLVALHRASLPIPVLGKVGEQYVRACFVKSKLYKNITQSQNLGYVVSAPGKNRLDLRVAEILTGTSWAVSVKNQVEWLTPRHRWIGECIAMAKLHSSLPWLVPSFATPEAMEACRRQGVRCTPIGSRVAPAEDAEGRQMKRLLDRLYPYVGGEPWVLMGADRLYGQTEPELVRRINNAASIQERNCNL